MIKWIEKLKEEDGFTLVEMMIVVLIVGLLLLMVIPNVSGVTDGVTSTTDQGVVQTVESQWLLYRMEQAIDPGAEVQADKLVPEYIDSEQAEIYNNYRSKPAEIPGG